ncbi:hypothetical protein EJB05_42642, partial [Eragrostis curvula]
MGTTATPASVAGGLLRRLENQWGLIPSTLHEGMKWPLLILNFMLSTASAKQPVDEMMGAWTTEINQALYDAEDLMDDLEGRPISKRTFFLSPCSLLWRITVTQRIKTISRKLDIGAKVSLKLASALKASPHVEQHESTVNVHGATLIGRYREKEEIKSLLMQNDGEITLSIVSIVGLPGMGKTSLARLLFDDKGEGWDFDLRIWISLGKHLDLRNIAACIISKAKRSVEEGLSQVSMNDLLSLEWMINKVQEILDNKSCLIVLDSLWSVDDTHLIYLKEMLGAKQKCTKKQINAPAKLQMHDLVHEFLRYIASDLVVLEYGGNAQDESSAKLQFRYAVLSNSYRLSSVHKDLIVRSKAVHFRNCKETKQIADAFSLLGHSRIINLSGCPIAELPASIGKLKNLRYLDVSDSGIETVPNEVSCLRNLESLDLAKNHIKVIPSFVGSFQKLKYFNLHGCEKIEKLPPTLGSLKKLEHLNLSCCTGIGELPVSLCSLLQLRLLDLSGCTKLQELPDELGNLKGLYHLNLAGCSRLKKLPNLLTKPLF